jgi:hypothetical protein
VSGRSAFSAVCGFAVPEFIYVAYGTTEVVPFHETSRARAPAPHGQIREKRAFAEILSSPLLGSNPSKWLASKRIYFCKVGGFTLFN